MGLPIKEVYVFYICNHTGSRVSNCISLIVKLPCYVELVNYLVVEAFRADHI